MPLIKTGENHIYFLLLDRSSSIAKVHLVPPSKIFRHIISLFLLTINILLPFTKGVCVEEMSLIQSLLPFFLLIANSLPIALVMITMSFLITGKASMSEKALVVSFTSTSIKLLLHISFPLFRFNAKNSPLE